MRPKPTARGGGETRGRVCPSAVRPEGDTLAPLGELVRGLQHLHQEGVNGRVTNQFEEEQVLQALQTNGAQRREPQQELCKPRRWRDIIPVQKTDGPTETLK